MEVRPVSLPTPAASPIAASELEQAARDLFTSGHHLSRLEKSFWKGERWEKADATGAVETLRGEQPLRLETAQGQQATVAGPEDLLEASALLGRGEVGKLASPLLAGSLRVLQDHGRLLLDGQPGNSYVAYNALTEDPRHPGGRLELEAGALKIPLRRPEDALTAAYLAAGFGDGTGVDPRAQELADLAARGLKFSNGSALAAYHQPARVSVDGVDLGQADDPALKERLQGYRQTRALLQEETARWWPVLAAEHERSLDERARLAHQVGSEEAYRTVLESAGPRETLAQAAAPLEQARSVLPHDSTELMAAYRALRALPAEGQPDYLGRLKSCHDASLASRAGQDPELDRLLADLPASPGERRKLLHTALTHGPLKEQRDLLLAAASYPDGARVYDNWARAIPVEARGEFLALRAEEPALDRLTRAWDSLALEPEHLTARREAWSALRRELPPETASDRASELIARVRGDRPLESARTYLRLEESGAEDPAAVWSKLRESSSPETALELYLLSRDAEQAVAASRWLQRRDLPAGRDEALVQLAGAHGGDLGAATRDLLFLASRQPEELPQAAGLLSQLLEATGSSSREARLAFSALENMDPEVGAARLESLMQSLRITRTYSGAQPLWEALTSLPPEEGKRRLTGLSVVEDLSPEIQTRLLAGQLRAPLDDKALGALSGLLGRGSALRWQGGEGWSQAPSGWSYEGRFADGVPCLESSPIRLPDGEISLAVDTAWNLPEKCFMCLEVSRPGSAEWKSVRLYSSQGDSQGEQFLLEGWEGQTVRFRLRPHCNDGLSGQGKFELRGLKLSERRAGPIQTSDIKSWTQTTIGDDTNTTSPWIPLDATSPTELDAQIQLALRKHGNSARLEIESQSAPGFQTLKTFYHTSDYRVEKFKLDLSRFQGETIRLRYVLNAPIKGRYNFESAQTWMYPPRLVPVRKDQSGAARLDLYRAGGLADQDAERVLSLAYGPQDPARRSQGVRTLARLKETAGSFDSAWKVWERMAPELGQADFEDRAMAYASLLGKGEAVEASFAVLEQEREEGEKLEPAARLLSSRSLDDWRALRRRVKAEGQDLPLGASMEFLAGLGDSRESVDRAWEVVAMPVLDESLAERQTAFGNLARSCGSLDEAMVLYGQVGQWLEPGDTLPAAVEAVARLPGVIGKDLSQVRTALAFIQEHQQSGALAGQKMSTLVRRLLNLLVVREGPPPKLEEALRELLVPQVGPGSVQEHAERVIVGGVPVAKKG